VTAAVVGLLLAFVVSLVPLAYAALRDRTALGCVLSLFTAMAAPVLWFGPASSLYLDVLPDAWTACGSPLRTPLTLLVTPSLTLGLAGVLPLAIRWSAEHEGK
jgi:hypothetical protein